MSVAVLGEVFPSGHRKVTVYLDGEMWWYRIMGPTCPVRHPYYDSYEDAPLGVVWYCPNTERFWRKVGPSRLDTELI